MTAHLARQRHTSSREKQDGASSAVSAVVNRNQLSGSSALFLLFGVSTLDATRLHNNKITKISSSVRDVTTGRCCTIQSVRRGNDTKPDWVGDKLCSSPKDK